jgi:hypothetical protein
MELWGVWGAGVLSIFGSMNGQGREHMQKWTEIIDTLEEFKKEKHGDFIC